MHGKEVYIQNWNMHHQCFLCNKMLHCIQPLHIALNSAKLTKFMFEGNVGN